MQIIPTHAETYILNLIKKDGKISSKEIYGKKKFSVRQLRYAIKKLLQKQIIQRVPDLGDLRSFVYILDKPTI